MSRLIKNAFGRISMIMLYAVYALSALCMSAVTLLAAAFGFCSLADMMSCGRIIPLNDIADDIGDIICDTLGLDENRLILVLVMFVLVNVVLWYVLRNDEDRTKFRTVNAYVFRINMCLVSSLIALLECYSTDCYHSTESRLILLAEIILAAFAGELFSLLMLRNRHRLSWRDFTVFFAVAVLAVGTYGIVRLDIGGYQRYIPQTEDIEYVRVEYIKIGSAEGIEQVRQLNALILDSRKENENSENVERFDVSYYLKDGGKLEREYYISCGTEDEPGEQVKLANRILSSREAAISRYEISNIDNLPHFIAYVHGTFVNDDMSVTESSCDLTEEQFIELYTTCILPDVMDGNLGKYTFLDDDDEYNDSMSNVEIFMNYMHEDTGYRGYHFNVDLTASRTLEWLEKNTDVTVFSLKDEWDLFS